MRLTVVGVVVAAALLGSATVAATMARPAAGSLVLSTAAAPGGALGSTSVVRLTVDGVARTYRLFVPADLPSGPRPLLVALHGYRSTASGLEHMTGLDVGAARAGVVVAYPDGRHRSWDAGTCCGWAVSHHVDDVGFLTAVVDDVRTRETVDSGRIAVGGFSNGGMMSYRFACEHAERISGVVAMSATVVRPSCRPDRAVSLLAVHGLDDDVVPFPGLAWSRLDRRGFPPAVAAVDAIASGDRCAGWSAPRRDGEATTTDALGCAERSNVRLVTSAPLGHHWPVGEADAAAFDIDMTRLTWQFLTAVWASR